MLNFLKENKLMAGGVGFVVVAIALYFALSGGEEGSALIATTPKTSAVSRELLATLSDLKGLSLDAGIFSDPAFQSLVDFRVEIPLQPVGRVNPFAPLEGGVRAGTGN